jgi:hypothetical protein
VADVALILTQPGGPKVVHKILHPENEKAAVIVPRALLLHTVVDAKGDTDLAAYEDREDVPSRVHFFIHSNPGSPLDGQIDQLLDTTRRAAASGTADAWALAAETEDNSAAKGSDIDGLTPKALASYIWLCLELNRVHPTIPLRRCTDSAGAGAWGFGYHSQPMRERWRGTSHNPWTKYQGKTCPGDKKVAQYEQHIIPALLGHPAPAPTPAPIPEDWFDMATREELDEVVKAHVDAAEARIMGQLAPIRGSIAAVELQVAPKAQGGRSIRTLLEMAHNVHHDGDGKIRAKVRELFGITPQGR